MKHIVLFTLFLTFIFPTIQVRGESRILTPDAFKVYIDGFNHGDNELYRQYIPNDSAWAFLKDNIPFFQCPDKEVET
ncbi:MAG: hypothetical protein K2M65_02235, partial [Muribaculaceae bacterium]|nr:hypothetical protein [Muribaculaceae bacterium]